MPNKIINEELKNQIIKFYLSKPMTLKEVADKFNLSCPTIGKVLKDTPKYSKAKLNNPNLQENFFKTIDSEEKAYFLGLLIADGNVFQDGTGRQSSISIALDSKDEYMLNKFKEILVANTSVNHDGRGCSQIAIRSNIMADDLARYGVIPRKSAFTYLPTNIPSNLMNHLIRGIFDGDGSIQAKLNKKDSHNRFLHSFSFCGTHRLMEDISNYCIKNLKLNISPKVYDYADKNLSDIKIQNVKDMYCFGEWLYQNATIYLTRKRKTYDDFKLHYNLE